VWCGFDRLGAGIVGSNRSRGVDIFRLFALLSCPLLADALRRAHQMSSQQMSRKVRKSDRKFSGNQGSEAVIPPVN
jgi:hypothetical protein